MATPGGIYIMDLDKFAFSNLTNGWDAHYSIDGSLFSYTLEGQFLYTYNLKSSTAIKINLNLPWNYLSNPHLTPDNSRIIFQADSLYYTKN